MKILQAIHPPARWLLPTLLTLFPAELRAANDSWAVHSQNSTPGKFTEFINLKDDSSILNPGNNLFPSGAVCYGATFMDEVFYGIEFDSGVYRLVTIPLTAFPTRTQIGPVGFPNVEALACVEGQLIGVSIQFTPKPHHTKLLSIDAETGAGTLIGIGSVDAMIHGLAYDPLGGVLYGAGKANDTVGSHNLYIIDPATGATTLVGPFSPDEPDPGPPLPPVIQSLSWSETHGLIGAFAHLYSISTTTGEATQIGSTDYSNGGTAFNGLYALASPPPVAPPAPFRIISIARSPAGMTNLEWNSEPGFDFQVRYRDSLSSGSWSGVSSVLPGTSGTMTFMHSSATPTGFYEVTKDPSPP